MAKAQPALQITVDLSDVPIENASLDQIMKAVDAVLENGATPFAFAKLTYSPTANSLIVDYAQTAKGGLGFSLKIESGINAATVTLLEGGAVQRQALKDRLIDTAAFNESMPLTLAGLMRLNPITEKSVKRGEAAERRASETEKFQRALEGAALYHETLAPTAAMLMVSSRRASRAIQLTTLVKQLRELLKPELIAQKARELPAKGVGVRSC